MLTIYISLIAAFNSPLARRLGERDPIGKIMVDEVERLYEKDIKADNKLEGNDYTEDKIEDDIPNLGQEFSSKLPKTEKEKKEEEIFKEEMNSPIIPTPEERLLMKNNAPVVMNYLVRPEQMLLLMKHER